MVSIPNHLLEEKLQQIIEGMIYVASRLDEPRMHRISKIFYFADKAHLEKYGRKIFSDHYIAMRYGPVPSYAYDVFKDVCGNGSSIPRITAKGAFIVDNESIIPEREPDLDDFSESDIECIDQVIEEYGSQSFPALTTASHDDAWRDADLNGEISTRSIINSLPNGDKILEFDEAQSF